MKIEERDATTAEAQCTIGIKKYGLYEDRAEKDMSTTYRAHASVQPVN